MLLLLLFLLWIFSEEKKIEEIVSIEREIGLGFVNKLLIILKKEERKKDEEKKNAIQQQ